MAKNDKDTAASLRTQVEQVGKRFPKFPKPDDQFVLWFLLAYLSEKEDAARKRSAEQPATKDWTPSSSTTPRRLFSLFKANTVTESTRRLRSEPMSLHWPTWQPLSPARATRISPTFSRRWNPTPLASQRGSSAGREQGLQALALFCDDCSRVKPDR